MPARKSPKVPDLKTLADPVKAAAIWQKDDGCAVIAAYDTIPEDQHGHFTQALENKSARSFDIANALQALGVDIRHHEVQMHRVNACRCAKEETI